MFTHCQQLPKRSSEPFEDSSFLLPKQTILEENYKILYVRNSTDDRFLIDTKIEKQGTRIMVSEAYPLHTKSND